MGRFEAKIGEREIVAKIKEKEKAQENYEDAVASGNAAVYVEQNTNTSETMKIKLGNLLPLQEAKLRLQLIFSVPVDCGSYKFTLPADFYPNYKKFGAPTKHEYTFSFDLNIKSTKKIT